MMGGVSPETCWASYKYEIKFCYTVASCRIFYVSCFMFLGRFISGRCEVYVLVANTCTLREFFINAWIWITPSMSMWTITVTGQEIWRSYIKSVPGTALQVCSMWLQSKQLSYAYTSFRLILTLKSYYIHCRVKVKLPRDKPLVAQRGQ